LKYLYFLWVQNLAGSLVPARKKSNPRSVFYV
jgi:hypothetical protein